MTEYELSYLIRMGAGKHPQCRKIMVTMAEDKVTATGGRLRERTPG